MRSLETNTRRRRHQESGFSLLELTIVMAIGIITTVVSVVSLVPMLKKQHVVNAYNTTLSAMRLARDNAVSQNTVYSLVFSNSVTPNTITIAPTVTFSSDVPSTTYTMPLDVTFQTNSAIASPTTAPDTAAGSNFGTGALAMDFGYTGSSNAGGSTAYTIYFCPDGSAQTSSICAGANYWDDGVVYLGMAGGADLLSSRAITLWGGTGRVRGWRLYPKTGGGYQWLRQ